MTTPITAGTLMVPLAIAQDKAERLWHVHVVPWPAAPDPATVTVNADDLAAAIRFIEGTGHAFARAPESARWHMPRGNSTLLARLRAALAANTEADDA